MEVFSYVGASAARHNSEKKEKKNSFPVMEFNRGKNRHGFSLDYESAAGKNFYGSLEKTRESLSKAASKVHTYLPLFACALIFVAVPVTLLNIASYRENHITSLKLNPDISAEIDALNAAMAKFAMETVVSDVDENGNVLGDDGRVLTAANVGVGQVVTYRDYKVSAGDSISSITKKFGLSNISTLIALNDIENVRSLRAGQKLKIPSQDGLVHKVQSGESLNALSVKYHVSVEEILDANDLTSDTLAKGVNLFIPGAKMNAAALKKAMGELFVCPITAGWRLTSYFGPRKDPFSGAASNHTGIDMACAQGTPIRAAMSGTVAKAGWSNVFGNYIIINHGNGYQSLYAHMLKITVKAGQSVDQNTKVGLVGSTGYSTGPHLHFTVYKNGKLVDPLTLIRR